jgi:hypothetical protein
MMELLVLELASDSDQVDPTFDEPIYQLPFH